MYLMVFLSNRGKMFLEENPQVLGTHPECCITGSWVSGRNIVESNTVVDIDHLIFIETLGVLDPGRHR